MDRLQKNQMNFINLRLGTFIHFNSATVQFQEGSVKDWEWEYENTIVVQLSRHKFNLFIMNRYM